MKAFIQSVKNWFINFWAILVYDLSKLINLLYSAASFVILAGLMYFFYHILVAGNFWQSMASFFIGGTIATVLFALLHIAKKSDEGCYELAIIDLRKQLDDAELNYDLIKLANESLQRDKENLQSDVKRQGTVVLEMIAKYNKIYTELDALKAERFRRNIGTSKIDEKGNIV